MMSLSDDKQAGVIGALNTTSRYLNDVLNINNVYFDNMVSQIYPLEPQLNKANASDTEAAFLDLHLSISNDIVSTKVYDKRDESCREEIAGALQEFCNRWCKREHVESNALNSWKLNIFKNIDGRISFYCNNLDLLPPKPKFTFRHLKKGIQEFHRKFVLAPADKAAYNVVVV